MRHNFAKLFTLILGLGVLIYLVYPSTRPVSPLVKVPLWQVRSIDTMKYSRDLAREKAKDSSFDQLIDLQVAQIASTGASHVAIATPYDSEFVPFLTRWVEAARRYHLSVWFRGNLSGWEEWFDYPPVSTKEHIEGVVSFIKENPMLFENGDYFSSCPECENGHLGDPRSKWKVEDYRQFLLDEHQAVSQAFRDIGKNVNISLNSMNYDVATLVMDEETTRSLGGVVAIDHYVSDSHKLARDVEVIAKKSGGQVFLGEYGAPIPDLNGKMTGDEQARWLNEALTDLASSKSLIGVNYWVGVGGSTELWNVSGVASPAVSVISDFYQRLK